MTEAVIEQLACIVGEKNLLTTPAELFVYESDAVSIIKGKASAVLTPVSAAQVSAIVTLANQHNIPFVARGAGTGLSGGCTATEGAWIISTARLNRILEIDLENRVAVVQPGVVNSALSEALAPHGYHFAPDPSSQHVCTVGGNFAENAGGPHCLKYGMTASHILGAELVLPDGERVRYGGKVPGNTGYDLLGILVGSEGTLGIVTELTVRIIPLPQSIRTFLATFNSVVEASQAVSAIIASGITPAALEMLDRLTLVSVEEYIHAGYPQNAGAVLLIEVDGLQTQIDEESELIRKICAAYGSLGLQESTDETQRKKLWQGRKNAFGAFGRMSHDFFVMDGVVPRSKLPEIMQFIENVSAKYQLQIANVFHAGDGNLHPNILFDIRNSEMAKRVLVAGEEILKECVRLGGAISGEHGIGSEKQNLMPLLFSAADLNAMERVKLVFNGKNLCNPDKIFPTGKSCGELSVGNYLTVASWI